MKIRVISTYVPPKVRLARRLKRIAKKKAEILKLREAAEAKYFRDRSISLDTYTALIKDYQLREVKLEEAERKLQEKVRRKKRKTI